MLQLLSTCDHRNNRRQLHQCRTRPQAWSEAPLDALQLAAHLRDVRDGKGERERFHDAAAWLAARHPRTLIANLERVAQVTPAGPCLAHGSRRSATLLADDKCHGGPCNSTRSKALHRHA